MDIDILRVVPQVLIGATGLLYIATIVYFLKYNAIILAYFGHPDIGVPVWAIPEQVKHFTTLIKITIVFTIVSFSFNYPTTWRRC
jgi:hypothetical protein